MIALHRYFHVVPILAGVVAAAVGLQTAPERIWPSLLLNGFYLLSLGVSAMFFISTQRLTGARWSAGLRRIPEALMGLLPNAAILMLALYLGRHTLYAWSRPGAFAHEAAGKAVYLQTPFVFARMAAVLLIWNLFAWLFRRTSLMQDRGLLLERRLNRLAAAFAVVFALSFTVAAYDWLLSLDPGWSSTMFAVYVFAGTFVQGIAAITLAVVWLRRRGFLADVVSDAQLHDLGKMLFAFSTFWAYIWTCQYLLIWYGNIPEEVSHYLVRTSGPWRPLFALNLMINWVVPFCVLLSARTKRKRKVLATVSVLLLIGHWLDLYLLIMPALAPAPAFGPLELAVAAGYASLAIWIFFRSLSRAPLVPLADPVLLANRGARA